MCKILLENLIALITILSAITTILFSISVVTKLAENKFYNFIIAIFSIIVVTMSAIIIPLNVKEDLIIWAIVVYALIFIFSSIKVFFTIK